MGGITHSSPLVRQIFKSHAGRQLPPPQALVTLHPEHVLLLRPAPTPPSPPTSTSTTATTTATRASVRLASLQTVPRLRRIPPPRSAVTTAYTLACLGCRASSGAYPAATNASTTASSSTRRRRRPSPPSHDEGILSAGTGRRGSHRRAVFGLVTARGRIPSGHLTVPANGEGEGGGGEPHIQGDAATTRVSVLINTVVGNAVVPRTEGSHALPLPVEIASVTHTA